MPTLSTYRKMFTKFRKPIAFACRHFSTTQGRNKTVAVMGASGGKWFNTYLGIIAVYPPPPLAGWIGDLIEVCHFGL